MKNALLCAVAVLGASLAAADAAVIAVDAPVVSGTLTLDAAGNAPVDYLVFDVAEPGEVTIDVLSLDVLGGDASDGDSDLDPYVLLFGFDPAGDQDLLGAFIDENDDADFPLGEADGSVDDYDSYLAIDLVVGRYVLAISEFSFEEDEARSGRNDDGFDGTFADYQVSFTGVEFAADAVPLPAAAPLMALGLAGAAAARRRAKG